MPALDILEQSQEEAAVQPEPHRVLIVDDDESIAEVLSLRLSQQGYRTLMAHTGHDGLAQAMREKPSLVLLDLRLPDIDGLEVCERLADAAETSQIPVIILSGMERPDIIRCSRAAGCQYFVRKPYDPNALLILIRYAIDEAEQWKSM